MVRPYDPAACGSWDHKPATPTQRRFVARVWAATNSLDCDHSCILPLYHLYHSTRGDVPSPVRAGRLGRLPIPGRPGRLIGNAECRLRWPEPRPRAGYEGAGARTAAGWGDRARCPLSKKRASPFASRGAWRGCGRPTGKPVPETRRSVFTNSPGRRCGGARSRPARAGTLTGAQRGLATRRRLRPKLCSRAKQKLCREKSLSCLVCLLESCHSSLEFGQFDRAQLSLDQAHNVRGFARRQHAVCAGAQDCGRRCQAVGS